MFFSQAGPAHWLEQVVRARIARARELGDRGDRGASAVEWVVITAALILIVGVVGGLILTALRNSASQLDPNKGLPNGGGGPNP